MIGNRYIANTFFLLGLILESGCMSRHISIQVIDAKTSEPISGVIATCIKTKPRLFSYHKNSQTSITGQDGSVRFSLRRGAEENLKYPNRIALEHTNYFTADIWFGIVSPENLRLRIITPTDIRAEAPFLTEKELKNNSEDIRRVPHLREELIVSDRQINIVPLYRSPVDP